MHFNQSKGTLLFDLIFDFGTGIESEWIISANEAVRMLNVMVYADMHFIIFKHIILIKIR